MWFLCDVWVQCGFVSLPMLCFVAQGAFVMYTCVVCVVRLCSLCTSSTFLITILMQLPQYLVRHCMYHICMHCCLFLCSFALCTHVYMCTHAGYSPHRTPWCMHVSTMFSYTRVDHLFYTLCCVTYTFLVLISVSS